MAEIIKYHPGFVGGLGVLLWQYRDIIEIETEKWLSTEGIRMDVLIIKKDSETIIQNDMCRFFRKYNVLEYKRPDDELSIDVFAKVMAYAYLYKSQGTVVNQVPFDDLTVTLYRHRYPRALFEEFQEKGIGVNKLSTGIYRLENTGLFPVQVVVGKELDSKEYSMFRVLTPNAFMADLKTFNEIAFRVGDEAYKRYADSVFQVSVSANRQMYDLLLREDEKMCEALRDLLKEDFAAAEAKAEKKGEIKGVILLYHDEMGFTDAEITDRIVKRFLLDKDVAEELVRETLALQMV